MSFHISWRVLSSVLWDNLLRTWCAKRIASPHILSGRLELISMAFIISLKVIFFSFCYHILLWCVRGCALIDYSIFLTEGSDCFHVIFPSSFRMKSINPFVQLVFYLYFVLYKHLFALTLWSKQVDFSELRLVIYEG